MSPLSRCVLLFSLTFTGLFAEEKSLNDHLEDRVVLNAKYAKRFVEEAEESPYAKRLQPIEKELGSEWVGLLKKVKSSDDDQFSDCEVGATRCGETLRIIGPSAVLVSTATDCAGNTTTCSLDLCSESGGGGAGSRRREPASESERQAIPGRNRNIAFDDR